MTSSSKKLPSDSSVDRNLSRRGFIGGMTGVVAAAAFSASAIDSASGAAREETPISGRKFKPWSPGCLDLHHISTGRGSCMLAICPDGTTLMVDAGAIYGQPKYTIAPKPDGSKRPGEWLGRYASRHLEAASRREIDALLISHFHNDHIGDFGESLPTAKAGGYKLTGITDVAEILPIRRIIDRGFPDYNYPPAYYPPGVLNLAYDNYRTYVAHRRSVGQAVERFRVGSKQQIGLLRDPSAYPEFSVRNLAANGEVWTGTGNSSRASFPSLAGLPLRSYPDENICSTAIRITYGAFSYYTGGDLTRDVGYGNELWRDIESPVATVCGRVSVAVVNHHGYVNAGGPDFVRALAPKVFIVQAWDSAHPTIQPLYNMLSRELYPEPRAVFTTAIKDENVIATRDLAKASSLNGHVVVRVAKGSDQFHIEILGNSDESDTVVSTHGPYPCA